MGTIYASQAQLVKVAITQALLDGIDSDAVDYALQTASELVDSYLGTRFDLPLTSYGNDIILATCRIAAYLVLSGPRGFNPGAQDAEAFLLSHDRAVSWLKDVASGKATPAFPATVDAAGFNPQQQPFALAPAQGSIGVSDGSFASESEDDSFVAVGTVGPPRSRGW